MWKFQKKKKSKVYQETRNNKDGRDLSVIACTFVFTLQSVFAISVGVKECPRPLTGGSVL